MPNEKKIPDEKINSTLETLKDFQFIPVETEYKGRKLKFEALGFTDTMEFLSLFIDSPNNFLSKNEEKAREYISKSSGIKLTELRKAPAGFTVFALNKLLEAIDFDFFMEGSNELTVKMENLVKRFGISQDLLVDSQVPKAGQSDISPKPSP